MSIVFVFVQYSMEYGARSTEHGVQIQSVRNRVLVIILTVFLLVFYATTFKDSSSSCIIRHFPSTSLSLSSFVLLYPYLLTFPTALGRPEVIQAPKASKGSFPLGLGLVLVIGPLC